MCRKLRGPHITFTHIQSDLPEGQLLKIVTWNCNGALRNKLEHIDSLDADLVIIQECEDPSKSTKAYQEWANDYLWVGESKNKGVGIFPKKGHSVNPLNWSGTFKIEGLSSTSKSLSWQTEDLKLFLPFTLNDQFTILAAWTKGNNDKQAFSYIGQLWKYLQLHNKQLSGPDTLLIGDLNSNSRWDKEDRWWSHTDVVNDLSALGLESIYHKVTGEAQGHETKPTFFLQRKKEKAYHIDYAFASADLIGGLNLEVGDYDSWIGVSDHMPLQLNL